MKKIKSFLTNIIDVIMVTVGFSAIAIGEKLYGEEFLEQKEDYIL